jgi:hypothetical protein
MEKNGESILTFGSDWHVEQSAPLVAGTTVRIRYAFRRLMGGSDLSPSGQHSFNLTGFYSIDGGRPVTFDLGGRRGAGEEFAEKVIELPGSARCLELWFERVGLYGTARYDSDFGRNFRFKVYPALDVSSAVRRYVSELSRS